MIEDGDDYMSQKKYIQSVQRATKILEYIASKGSAKLVDIYHELKLNKSTVFGILQTLEYEGFVRKDRNGIAYKLGLESLNIGLSYLNSTELNSDIKRLLADLVELVDETAYFVLKTGDKYYLLDYVLSSQTLKVVPEERTFFELDDNTAVGKVYLHYQDDGFKYVKDLEKTTNGVNYFSAPYMIGDKIGGCMVIAGPSSRYTENKIDKTYNIYHSLTRKGD